ncbi:MAG TPA: sialidase family protein [Kofleriaceae bacterium]|nr:sialidase family protein [Kofleriaceae bacterium]
MRTRLLAGLCGLCCLLALSHEVSANGRAPAVSTINFRRGMDSDIVVGLTFGLVISHDGGATWSWMCELAVGYGGTYDPDYVYSSSGAVFATTFDGLQVMRDGCNFRPPLGKKFASAVAQGPNGALYYGAADGPTATDPGDVKIYRSDDDGLTWPVSSSPVTVNDWWQSLEVAPSDPNRVYLSGYRFVPNPAGGGKIREFLLFRSDDAGQSWQPLPTNQLTTMQNSTIEIAGISHTNPDLVFARVKLEDNAISDAIYRSTDAGQTWKRVLGKASAIAFVVRRSGELLAATQALGAVRSTNNGDTWTDLVGPPHINCLAENGAGEVWACTQNFGTVQGPSDGYGIMKSTDLADWTPVLKFQDIKQPVTCDVGTVQKDRCDTELWCGLCQQLGCQAGRACASVPVADNPSPGDKGCCNSAAPAPGALLLILGVGALLLRPRRR